MDGNHDETVEP